MSATVDDLIDLYEIPTGRRLFALRRTLELCRVDEEESEEELEGEESEEDEEQVCEEELAAFIRESIAEEEANWALTERWRRSQSLPRHAPEARPLNRKLNRALGGLFNLLTVPSHTYEEDSPEARASLALRSLLFGDNVRPLINKSYAEKYEAVRLLLKTLREPEQREAAELTGALPVGERIERINEAFSLTLNVNGDSPSHDDVEAALERGERRLKKVVAWVLGHFLLESDEHRAARKRLLGPILTQNAEVQERRRRRRSPTDIDPDTGVELSEETGAVEGPSPPETTSEPETTEGEATPEAGREPTDEG